MGGGRETEREEDGFFVAARNAHFIFLLYFILKNITIMWVPPPSQIYSRHNVTTQCMNNCFLLVEQFRAIRSA